ncbi:MAG: membrane protein insertion efficiency factor YidD [Desulfobacteraceae bacterium]|nr:membrane protein insertion efficiency factor YidD [Desulfobacteraceae bacterium]MDH3721222.1 membrane protein insertion efficiency factor YidD [Desulfobacteraceae bacterium]MDH3836600.1 membrane protein insertion efficiency factor YidD [Desulfobacteraceae bacterium]MDH3872677.1 membrane protein insertion efficiency factor YidD [Desulfobacteraceae bacterium]MDH3955874.1 membrane protein insertion efficiency factor YidD [Desulfobacteraceae bacterium]
MKKTLYFVIFFIVLNTFYGSILAGQDVNIDDHPQVSHEAEENSENASLYPIKFYQDYISSVDGNRCLMHPTCSQYCIEAFKKHGTFSGWIMCSDRLIRCGRDEKKLSDPVWIDGEKRSYDPVSNNDFWRK